MPVIFRRSNILDPYSWTTGSGGIGSFSQNGSTDENERVIGTDPFGNSSVLWETRANGSAADDGGWNHSSFSVDNTKLYRMSVWVKRTSSSAGGTFYLGTNGGGQCVLRLDGSYGEECNPYWDCVGTGAFTQNVWYLVVGHVFPVSYPNSNQHADTGRWTISGGKVAGINGCNVGNDMKFGPSTTSLNHRTYHYYCGDNTTRLQFFEPRVDLCDGSEPRITDLLNNTQSRIQSSTVTVEGASNENQKIMATGGVITEHGEWRIHRFNSSGTFTLSSLIGTSLHVEYLIVGGGGGGGMDMGGGGGGGGVLSGKHVLTPGSYTITVGAGGTGAPAAGTNGQPGGHQYTIPATAGGNSSFNGLTSIGGGFGGSSYRGYTPGIAGGNGGSGGGASGYNDNAGTFNGGSGTSGQGFRGGNSTAAYYSGGGGGADAQGTDSTAIANGGSGRLNRILGRPFYWGGGGGGAGYSTFGGAGGRGGGGAGAPNSFANNYGQGGRDSIEWGRDTLNGCTGCWTNLPGGDGGTNTGGGGGGGAHYNSNNKGGNGGSGIVIIRYKKK
jgi:hypothetical protein